MSSLDKKLKHIQQQICANYPDISIQFSDKTYWDPNKQIVFINRDSEHPIWSLLHEVGHAVLEHKLYSSDVSLLLMENAAWEEAKKLAKEFSIQISQDHIEQCLDSYRDWLYARSKCPDCSQTGVQDGNQYRCYNCSGNWKVSPSRFKRCYRKKIQSPTTA